MIIELLQSFRWHSCTNTWNNNDSSQFFVHLSKYQSTGHFLTQMCCLSQNSVTVFRIDLFSNTIFSLHDDDSSVVKNQQKQDTNNINVTTLILDKHVYWYKCIADECVLAFTDQVTVVIFFVSKLWHCYYQLITLNSLLISYSVKQKWHKTHLNCTVLILCKVIILYLVPGHDGLLVGCEIVINVRTGDHFALGDLCPLQVTYSTAKAETLLTLLHCQRHGHLHTVRRVSVKTQHFYIYEFKLQKTFFISWGL